MYIIQKELYKLVSYKNQKEPQIIETTQLITQFFRKDLWRW